MCDCVHVRRYGSVCQALCDLAKLYACQASYASCQDPGAHRPVLDAAAPVSVVQPYGMFPGRHASCFSPPLLARWLLQQKQLRYRKQEVMAQDESILKGSEKYPKPANRTFQYGTAGVCQMS